MNLGDRLEELGTVLGEREIAHQDALRAARSKAEELRGIVQTALDRFHGAIERAGASHIRISLGELRTDDKHIRAVEFDLTRGRNRAIVTIKSRGDVTLVGPFRSGKTEGPCRSFPFAAESEIDAALGEFLSKFLEEATTP